MALINVNPKKISTFQKIQHGPKIYVFDELVLDIGHRFSVNFRENESIEQIHFSSKKQYFITNLKAFLRMEPDIEKSNDYEKIVKLSDFCRKLVDDNEEGIAVKEITKGTNQRGFIKNHCNLSFRKKVFTILSTIFMIRQKKKIRSFFLCPMYDQLVDEGLTFKSSTSETYKIKLSEATKSVKTTPQWKRKYFDVKVLYHGLNAFYI